MFPVQARGIEYNRTSSLPFDEFFLRFMRFAPPPQKKTPCKKIFGLETSEKINFESFFSPKMDVRRNGPPARAADQIASARSTKVRFAKRPLENLTFFHSRKQGTL